MIFMFFKNSLIPVSETTVYIMDQKAHPSKGQCLYFEAKESIKRIIFFDFKT